MGGKNDAPPAPDYKGAAEEQAVASYWNTLWQTAANRPNVYTPWGNLTWSQTPDYYGGGGAPSYASGGVPSYAGGAPQGAPAQGGGQLPATGGPDFQDIFAQDSGAVARDMYGNPVRYDAYGQFGAPGGAPGGAGGGYASPGAGSGIPGWEMAVELPENLQAALDAEQYLQRSRSELGAGMMDRVSNELGGAPDYSGLESWGTTPGDATATRNRAEEALYGRAASRLDPRFDTAQKQLEERMLAQGLRPGDPLWSKSMEEFGRTRNDAYNQAMYSAITGGGAEAQRDFGMDLQASQYQNQLRQAQLSEMLQQRGWSLNEINALLSGQQVGMPQQPSFAMASQPQAPNYLGAAQSQGTYDMNAFLANQQSSAGLFGGLGSIIGGAFGSPWMGSAFGF